MLCVYILHTRPTTHDTMQNCLKWEAYWTFSLLVALANNFSTTQTHTNPYRYGVHAHTHTKFIQKLEWLADFFLSFFFVCFVIFFLFHFSQTKKKNHYHYKWTNSIGLYTDDFTVVLCCVLRFSSQFLLHLFIHLTLKRHTV